MRRQSLQHASFNWVEEKDNSSQRKWVEQFDEIL
jgi:hypothetical protein